MKKDIWKEYNDKNIVRPLIWIIEVVVESRVEFINIEIIKDYYVDDATISLIKK